MDNMMMPDNPMQPNTSPVSGGSPYFMGNEALIKFSSAVNGNGKDTYWLVNKSDHTIRPFESYMAMDAAFGPELEAALQNSVVIAQPNVDSEGNIVDGVLEDFSILSPEYAIREDGTSKPLHFSNHQLKSRFGKPIDQRKERIATEVLDGFLNLLKKNEEISNVPNDFIENIRKDEKLMAFYISSLAYGDYTLEDVYSDILHTYDNSNEIDD